MDVARRGHAEPALKRAADVGDDVAEQVVGDDHLELAGILDQEHGQRVDVEMRWRRSPGTRAATSLNTRCHNAWPCCMALLLSAMHTRVSPWAAAYSKAWRMMRCTPFQVLISSWMATSSVGAGLEAPADADVDALGVLAEHHEVDVGRGRGP